MEDCKFLKVEDVTPWRSDVFDHPDYKYTCEKTGKEILGRWTCSRCKDCVPKSDENQTMF